MSVFEHHRFEIWNALQHPYKHDLSEFPYSNPAFGDDVTNTQQALDYLTAVLYPQMKAAVANQAALPLLGNTINDMRVVEDDGDGKAASYRWEQREGEASPSWHKIYDVDFGTDSILQAFLIKTQDVYVSRYGYDDRDEDGNVIAGDLAGQSVYGGASANTNLTLFANSGDGVGPATGFVQFGDNVRPTSDNGISLGTLARRFSSVFTVLATVGTMSLAGGSISDSSGQISFADENLVTTGTVKAGTLTIADGSITDTSGSISFADENLSTTGTLAAGVITATSVNATGAASSFASGTTIGDLTFADGSITCAGAAISFGNENLSTTGTLSAGASTLTSALIGAISLSTGTITTNAGALELTSFTGVINVTAATLNAIVVDAATSVDGGNLRIAANTLSSLDANGNINFTPNGTGKVVSSALLRPSADGGPSLGEAAGRWNTLYLSAGLHDGSNSISIATLLSLRNINVGVAAGHSLFYDAGTGTWLSSAPDTEIAHATVSGLTTGDAGHTQFVMLAGRAGGQDVNGGTAASENLTLDSTAHATKGKIFAKSDFAAFTDASFAGTWSGTDLGGASNRFRHVYTAGEHFGFRLENLGAAPAASVANRGRLFYNTATGLVYVDTGTTIDQVGGTVRFQGDTVWNGTDLTKSVDVTTAGLDARTALWRLTDNSANFEEVYAKLEATDANTIVITVSIALPAGSYRLIGIQ